jgi:hypothetical protein
MIGHPLYATVPLSTVPLEPGSHRPDARSVQLLHGARGPELAQ